MAVAKKRAVKGGAKVAPARRKGGAVPPPAELEHIVEGLRPLAVPVGKLKEDVENARKHNTRNLETIKQSLVTYGQRAPLIARKSDGVILVGNGRLRVARELGWSTVAVLFVDDDVAKSKAFALMDNKSAELAEWDFQMLAGELAKLDSAFHGGLAEMTGFLEFEIDPLLRFFRDTNVGTGAVLDPQEGWKGMPDYKSSRELAPLRTIRIHFYTKEAVSAFAKLVGRPIMEHTKWLNFPEQEKVVEEKAWK